MELRAYVFEWRIFEGLDVACAERKVRYDYSCDEPFDRVGRLEDIAIGARADRGGDEAEGLGYELQ